MNNYISIVIPVFNEKENITSAITKTDKVLRYPHEFLFVYDFEEDNTVPIVRKLIKKNKKIHLVLNKTGGLINAIKNQFMG